jgi:hypothetical protein
MPRFSPTQRRGSSHEGRYPRHYDSAPGRSLLDLQGVRDDLRRFDVAVKLTLFVWAKLPDVSQLVRLEKVFFGSRQVY